MMADDVTHRDRMSGLADRLDRSGSVRFDEFVEHALYDPDAGSSPPAGGRVAPGDFLTSPEVGPLFGAVVARYLDAWWDELGRPDPFVVVEAGAGRGALALAVLAAEPACAGPALRAGRAVRRAARASAATTSRSSSPFELLGPEDDPDAEVGAAVATGTGPLVDLAGRAARRCASTASCSPTSCSTTCRSGSWSGRPTGGREVFVVARPLRRLRCELVVPGRGAGRASSPSVSPRTPPGSAVPLQAGSRHVAATALDVRRARPAAGDRLRATTAELAARPPEEWLRTYRGHDRGGASARRPRQPGHHLRGRPSTSSPASPNRAASGPRPTGCAPRASTTWSTRADASGPSGPPLGDLVAIRGRSRVGEAEALTDPGGLGAFTVLEWRR